MKGKLTKRWEVKPAVLCVDFTEIRNYICQIAYSM